MGEKRQDRTSQHVPRRRLERHHLLDIEICVDEANTRILRRDGRADAVELVVFRIIGAERREPVVDVDRRARGLRRRVIEK